MIFEGFNRESGRGETGLSERKLEKSVPGEVLIWGVNAWSPRSSAQDSKGKINVRSTRVTEIRELL
jgi:hypothetical protein